MSNKVIKYVDDERFLDDMLVKSKAEGYSSRLEFMRDALRKQMYGNSEPDYEDPAVYKDHKLMLRRILKNINKTDTYYGKMVGCSKQLVKNRPLSSNQIEMVNTTYNRIFMISIPEKRDYIDQATKDEFVQFLDFAIRLTTPRDKYDNDDTGKRNGKHPAGPGYATFKSMYNDISKGRRITVDEHNEFINIQFRNMYRSYLSNTGQYEKLFSNNKVEETEVDINKQYPANSWEHHEQLQMKRKLKENIG